MTNQSAKYVRLGAGDPAPTFKQRCTSNENYAFDSVGGRYIVMCFMGSAGTDQNQERLNFFLTGENRKLFDDTKFSFFGITADSADETQSRLKEQMPGIRHFWDFNGLVGKLYGSLPAEATEGRVAVRCMWFVLDPTLRIMKAIPFNDNGSDKLELLDFLKNLAPVNQFAGFEIQAPIIILPNVFEPVFCQKLIGLYQEDGGKESGFMQEVGGKTTLKMDNSHKKRRDYMIEDQAIIDATNERVVRRIVPEIQKVHQFPVTRIERHIVCCYAMEDGAHFAAHRDNTTRGTAHRRFAVSINLNDDFDGGEVSFPEYGTRSFKAPAGGAVIFSCSLLHAVSKVSRGRRYAFLPFLYDDAAAKIRQENEQYVSL